jgi:hypothetical protein
MVRDSQRRFSIAAKSYRVEKSAEHNHGFLLHNILSFTELDSLVVDLKGNKQIDRQTKILKTTRSIQPFCDITIAFSFSVLLSPPIEVSVHIQCLH